MRSTSWKRYLLYFFGWTLLALFFFTQSLTQNVLMHDPTPWWETLVSWVVGIYVLATLTPGVLWLGNRFPIERRNWKRRIPFHLVASCGFAIADLAVCSIVLPLIRVVPPALRTVPSALVVLFALSFHTSIITYWIILWIQSAVRYYHRYQARERDALRLELNASELKTQLAHAQLNALKMQLQPHFLFNTLNAIMVLVRQQRGRQAEEMLARLSDLLRCVLEDVDSQEVPLRRELECVQLYLSIEQVRFRDRLRVEILAEPNVLDAAVPQMGLQPIVENAIRHGIGRRSAAGKIQISATHVADNLELKIRDDGPGFSPLDLSSSEGIGLTNTRQRLNQLYGAAAKLRIENGEPIGAIVTMVIPYHVIAGVPEADLMEVHAVQRFDR